jgi:RimJ/RimL family protein N-acetyltransferase
LHSYASIVQCMEEASSPSLTRACRGKPLDVTQLKKVFETETFEPSCPQETMSLEDITLARLTNTTKNTRTILELLESQPRDYYRGWAYGRPTPASVRKLLDSNSTYAILLNEKQLVGIIGFTYKDKYFMPLYNGQYWLHYFVDKSQAGRGVATIAVRKMIDIICNELKIKRLYAGINSDNPSSLHLISKFGFVKRDERSGVQVFEKTLDEC